MFLDRRLTPCRGKNTAARNRFGKFGARKLCGTHFQHWPREELIRTVRAIKPDRQLFGVKRRNRTLNMTRLRS